MTINVFGQITTVNFFQQIHHIYDIGDIPFLQRQKKRVLRTKPYQGLKILHNIPLTLESLLKIENLWLGGADLTVTSPTFMQPNFLAINILKEAGIKVQIEHNFVDDFDFCLDCCGELLNQVTPRIGTSEITRTGSIQYGKATIDYPVISIDDCKIKNLEAVLGTGEAFVRAFQELTQTDIKEQEFLVVGYGKVGQGIVNALSKYTSKIAIAEKNQLLLDKAKKSGFIAINANNSLQVETQASCSFAVVTATGCKNIISDCFDAMAFKGRYLANMGGEDEFGYEFNSQEVLCAKNPINFAIEKPTLIKYLDPVFYAHNLAIEILQYQNLKPELHPFPSFLAEEIVDEWSNIFGEFLDF